MSVCNAVISPAAPERSRRLRLLISLLSSFIVFAIDSGAASAASRSPIALICDVKGGNGLVPEGFEAAFCSQLAEDMRRDLKIAVREGSGPGRAIRVELTVRSQYAAEVVVTLLPGGTTTRSRLSSRDSGLTPFSARTLVYPIGTLLGLV